MKKERKLMKNIRIMIFKIKSNVYIYQVFSFFEFNLIF